MHSKALAISGVLVHCDAVCLLIILTLQACEHASSDVMIKTLSMIYTIVRIAQYTSLVHK